MLWVHVHYNFVNSLSAGVVIKCQNLTSKDGPRAERVKRETDQREYESDNAGDDSTRTDTKFDVYFPEFLMRYRRDEQKNLTVLKLFLLSFAFAFACALVCFFGKIYFIKIVCLISSACSRLRSGWFVLLSNL